MKYYNISVNLSEEDLDQLQYNKHGGFYFDWTFPTEDKNVSVKIKLFKEEEE